MSESELSGAARRSVDTAWEVARRTVREARQAIWRLRHDAVGEEALPQAVEKMVAAARIPVPVRVRVDGKPRGLDGDLTFALLRISQEAIANGARHAGAARIDVSLLYGEQDLELRVEDDGRGMDAPPCPASGHFGIAGMKERAAEIGATLEITSVLGRGTRVNLRLPLERRS